MKTVQTVERPAASRAGNLINAHKRLKAQYDEHDSLETQGHSLVASADGARRSLWFQPGGELLSVVDGKRTTVTLREGLLALREILNPAEALAESATTTNPEALGRLLDLAIAEIDRSN